MNKVYIIAAKRTPIGSYNGSLAGFSAVELGSISIKAAIEQSKIDVSTINEVYYGNVLSANLGQAPATQAALGAGISNQVPTTLVNKVCASGMKSLMLGAQSIMLGHNNVVVTGGMESMSNIPYYLPNLRWGMKYGSGQVIDGLQKDGLTDAYQPNAMGVFADATASKYGISREEQDRYAIQSYTRSASATDAGLFLNEIAPVPLPQKKGDPILMTSDEEYKNVFFDKIPGLKPAFTKDGTVTAANASTMNDGASCIILASEAYIKAHGITPIAEVLTFADASHEPEWFTTAPGKAAPLALKRAGLTAQDIDYHEVNEAFSVVTMAFNTDMGLEEDKVNVNGGAVSLGHPLGASGSRIVITLCNVLQQKNGELGLAAICNGGGGASAMVIKRC
jgi:acetyl-CoA C-acetyltransferase